MIKGRFGGTSGRPYVDGRLVIPRLRSEGNVSFLLDTGADGTVLLPTDALRLGIDHRKLHKRSTSIGIGGRSEDFEEPALIVFSDGGILHVYDIELRILKPKRGLETAPSLLGRDVLNHWRIVLDHTRNRLDATIVSSDQQIRLQ